MKTTPKKIVIVEDSLHLQIQLKEQLMLINENFEIFIYRHTNITLKAINTIMPDIIIYCIEKKNEKTDNLLTKIDSQTFNLVLTSSYTDDALEAYNYDAMGFLLKPYSIALVTKICNKIIQNLTMIDIYKSNNSKFITIGYSNKIEIVKKTDIIYCKSEGKYTVFYLANGKNVISSTNIGKYEPQLSSDGFARVHHSYCVNLNYVNQIQKGDHVFCELNDGSRVPVSKRKEKVFFKLIRQFC
jgi:two-component system LytT family response regulator